MPNGRDVVWLDRGLGRFIYMALTVIGSGSLTIEQIQEMHLGHREKLREEVDELKE